MWILVLVVSTITAKSLSVTTAEFDSLGSCTVAASQIREEIEPTKYVQTLCVKK